MSPAPLRVLVVDDSVVFRRAVSEVLQAQPGIEVVSTARNGREALSKLPTCRPDLVTLDLEMPEMDGLATLKAMRAQGNHTRVMVLTSRCGDKATVEALCLGAEDFIVKPSGGGGLNELSALLLPKVLPRMEAPRPARIAPRARAPVPLARIHRDVIVIGISTGGPNALAQVIPQLPPDLDASVLVVQHMPPLFTRTLAERLDAKSRISVCEAQQGQRLERGKVYLAPGDYHMIIEGDRIKLHQGPPENSCRPAVDVLFRSAAQQFGKRCLAVVMTGMGKDGFEGCRAVAARGGGVIAQDQASSVVWGMPRFVAEAGLAEQVLPLNEIGGAITAASKG